MRVHRQSARRVDGLDRLRWSRDRGIEIRGHEIDRLAHAVPGVLFGHQAMLQDELEDGARHHCRLVGKGAQVQVRSEEHTSELQSLTNLVCRLLLEKKKTKNNN